MQFKYIVFVLMAWVVTALLVGVAEGSIVGGAADPVTGETASTTLEVFLTGDFFARGWAMVNMMFFNFPNLFSGGWAILQWIFFIPFSAAFGIMMAGYVLAHIPIVGRGT